MKYSLNVAFSLSESVGGLLEFPKSMVPAIVPQANISGYFEEALTVIEKALVIILL